MRKDLRSAAMNCGFDHQRQSAFISGFQTLSCRVSFFIEPFSELDDVLVPLDPLGL